MHSGVPVTAETLATMNERAVERLPGVASQIQDVAAGTARVKHFDETGFQIAGQTQYPHAICTHLAAYRIGGGRSALLSGISGIVVHDHRKPHFTMEDVEHTMCNAPSSAGIADDGGYRRGGQGAVDAAASAPGLSRRPDRIRSDAAH